MSLSEDHKRGPSSDFRCQIDRPCRDLSRDASGATVILTEQESRYALYEIVTHLKRRFDDGAKDVLAKFLLPCAITNFEMLTDQLNRFARQELPYAHDR